MKNTNVKQPLSLTGQIKRTTHSIDNLRKEYPNWDNLSDEEKLKASRSVDPTSTDTFFNVTTVRFHEYLVDNVDPLQSDAKDNITELWLALGDDEASGTSENDTDLNNRLNWKEVTDTADNGTELLISTFLSSSEANGTFDELGIFSGNPANLSNSDVFMLNHAGFSDVTKDNTETATFDVTLTFSDV